MHMQLHALNGIQETIAALKIEAAGYRTQARAVSDTVPLLRQTLKQREYQLRQVLQDGESSSSQIRGARSAVSRAGLAVDKAISEAMLLEQRAATIEGSIISLSLQAQTQAAAAVTPAPVALPVAAPVRIAVPTPIAAPVPVPVPLVESTPVIVTAPAPASVTPSPVMKRAGVSTFAPSPQPSPRIQPFTPAAASTGPDEITTPQQGKNILPLALAAGAVLLLLIKPKRKRRNA